MQLNIKKLNKDPVRYFAEFSKKEQGKVLDVLEEAFHEKMEPMVSDKVYDLVYDWFTEKYPKSKRIQKTGHKIGNKREEVILPVFMPSLQKIKPETKAFDKYVEDYDGPFCLTDKLDGISLEVIYFGGVPIEAYTRGDGTKGKDVSRHIPNFKIPKKISTKKRLVARSEAIVKESTFKRKFSKEHGGKYTAERNAVGGFINNTKADSKDLQSVDVIFYEILEGTNANKKLSVQLAYLTKLGFNVVKNKLVKRIDSEILRAYYSRRIEKSKYQIDGIVVANDTPYERTASLPKHAKAFKENNESDMQEVKVTKVQWEMSKGNKWIPRVFYPMTNLDGVQNNKATGHNAFFIMNGFRLKDKDKGMPIRPLGPGAIVKIVRSGKVIPHIVEVIKASKGRTPQMPESDYVMKGADAYFTGKHDAAHAKQMTHFFVTVGIDGLKLTSINKLIDNGYDTIKKVIDAKQVDLANIEGIGAMKSKQWTRQIQMKLGKVDIPTLADASTLFEGFSNSRLTELFNQFPDVKAIKTMKRAELRGIVSGVKGFKKLADVFVAAMPEFRKFIKRNGLELKMIKKVKAKGSKFKDMKITFTGGRDKPLEELIVAQGGTIQNMKNNTSILVIKDSNFTSNKIDKANDKNIPVMTQAQFKKKFKV